jgi:hypothetical protein
MPESIPQMQVLLLVLLKDLAKFDGEKRTFATGAPTSQIVMHLQDIQDVEEAVTIYIQNLEWNLSTHFAVFR